jgi:hypothetical protein
MSKMTVPTPEEPGKSLTDSINALRREIEAQHAARLPMFAEQRQALDAAITATTAVGAGLATVRTELDGLRAEVGR